MSNIPQTRKLTTLPRTLSQAFRLTSNLRLLLADDDPDMRMLLAERLRNRGHTVSEFEDGAELASYLEEQIVNPSGESLLLITDIRMPRQDGLTVLASARQRGLVVPVIVISGLEQNEIYDAASELDVAALFQKPFDVEHLCYVVDLLARHARD